LAFGGILSEVRSLRIKRGRTLVITA